LKNIKIPGSGKICVKKSDKESERERERGIL
jgi:hypothetical protein